MPRKLSAEERLLWDKVVASVRPLHEAYAKPLDAVVAPAVPAKPVAAKGRRPSPRLPAASPSPPPSAGPGTTLDASWDKKLARGLVSPDMIVDLHGHNLATAYAVLDSRLDDAIHKGDRLILLVTGKPPKGERWPVARGAIRAAVGDWLHASRHASAIAAVRGAHQRHGGTGALYIILRRRK
ncbi:Smr/MutS family protein [Allosphingosinicella vermicomposti]|uniref:Smr/MutS family protein n=1 Tax=Allosphingosinicella vermicomposti TaxID=614671 RepID=UPI000D0F0172|nr:Smr/MutS family protein [Allosphingosinicella vermicomposti]